MDPLDSELRRALSVDPSPELLARIRTRVAAEPVHGRSAWTVIAPAIFAMAVVVVAAVFLRRTPAPTVERATSVLAARTIATTPVTAPLSAPSRIATIASSSWPSETVWHVRSLPAMHVTEPEVLIAADEAAALRRLIFGVQQGRLHLSPSLAASPPVRDIAIEPITITPIPPLTGNEGARP
jgi:hypothetical protein